MPAQRNTNQRQVIREAISQTDRPLGPQEILDVAKRKLPGLGIATVYRAVKTLLEEGWLVEVAVPGEPSRYEHAGKHHHHHFQCNNCRRLFELPGCSKALRSLAAPEGFEVERHELILYGRCVDCQKAVA